MYIVRRITFFSLHLVGFFISLNTLKTLKWHKNHVQKYGIPINKPCGLNQV